MPDPIEFFVIPFLIAAGISLAVLTVAWRPWTRRHVDGRWGGPVALAIGVLSAYRWIVDAWPTFPATEAKGWIFYTTVGAAALGLLVAFFKCPKWMHWTAAILVALCGPVLLLNRQLSDSERMVVASISCVVMFLAGVVWWLALERSEGEPRMFTPIVLFLLALFSDVRLMMTNSITFGRMGLALVGATAPMILISALRPGFSSQGAILVFVAFQTNLLLAAMSFANLDPIALTLICITPVLMAAWKILRGGKTAGLKSNLISLSLLVLPLVIMIFLRLPAFLKSLEVDESGYGY